MPLPVELPHHVQLPEATFDQFAAACGLPPVFGPDVLMNFLNVESRKTIYALHAKGLPRFAVGRRVRYRRDQVLAWLEDQKLERPGRGR
jgi:excisionase family DNA binding protein